MTVLNWQLQSPSDAVIFDCDGTLSTIEGIDFLAEKNGVGEKVQILTQEAMTQTGINPDVYQKRLELTQPTQMQVCALGAEYISHCVTDVFAIIQIFKRLNKSVYILSAGLLPAVAIFGEYLQIPRSHIFAVDVQFDSAGSYQDFDRTSPLINNVGKRVIVSELKKQHSQIVYVGDGMNDYSVFDIVPRFVGYGGAYYRENIAKLCQYYIANASMAPLLPLSLTQNEYPLLMAEEKALYAKGLIAIEEGKVIR